MVLSSGSINDSMCSRSDPTLVVRCSWSIMRAPALFSLVLFPFLIAWVLVLQHFQRKSRLSGAVQQAEQSQRDISGRVDVCVKTIYSLREAAQFKTFRAAE